MKRILIQSLLASNLLLFGMIASAQTSPERLVGPFHSPDQYELAHSRFDKLSADLQQARSHDPVNSAMFDRAQAVLRVLEQNWDSGHYESRQIEGAITAIQTVQRDSRLIPQDVNALADDLSQLLDFRTEYY
jgi:hypothetical protein